MSKIFKCTDTALKSLYTYICATRTSLQDKIPVRVIMYKVTEYKDGLQYLLYMCHRNAFSSYFVN